MSFDDVVFPIRLARGSAGGPAFSTDVVEVASGYERRNRNWDQARMSYDVGSRTVELVECEQLIAFFRARAGKARGFRYPDPLDFKSCALAATPTALDQQLGTGDGANQVFQLVKRYSSGGQDHLRTITRPRTGTVLVGRGGVQVFTGFTVDHAVGRISFTTPPAPGVVVSAGFLFDVPVRFETDEIRPSALNKWHAQLPEVPLVEIRS
ncbi:MAG: DUF2460 domain-containing protein [Sandarakinorhabdus sp.]|nr:DUF2460 domain-containing protein [Sandarakinorhabdus sp.]